MRLKSLLLILPSLFFAGLSPSLSQAATTTANPGDNIIGIIRAAKPGDIVQLNAGTFNVTSPITVPTGVIIVGQSPSTTHVVFNLAGGATTSYGFIIAGNASNVGIGGLDIYSNHGVICMGDGSGYTNIMIVRNNLQFGGGHTRVWDQRNCSQ